MTYPADALFDIETLVNVAQAEQILVLTTLNKKRSWDMTVR